MADIGDVLGETTKRNYNGVYHGTTVDPVKD